MIKWLIFKDGKLIKKVTNSSFITETSNTPSFSIVAQEDIGDNYTVGITDSELTDDYEQFNLRENYKNINSANFSLLSKAVHIYQWLGEYRFCGKCGTKTARHKTERAMVCPSCGLMRFPRMSPAIIVAIKKDDKILLAHNRNFKENSYSVIAGFVDVGENVENAIHREVKEEVGITIKNIEFLSSQSWPFPDSLMIGFMAEWESGDITPDGEEIIDGNWYDRDSIKTVNIPTKKAIGRHVIEAVLGELNHVE